jgi:leucyl aminopeptidase
MPLEESHQEFLTSQAADLLSDANDTAPGAAIAAAFLQNFVEEGVEWIHLDVAGPCIDLKENRGTGFGARLLVQLSRLLAEA